MNWTTLLKQVRNPKTLAAAAAVLPFVRDEKTRAEVVRVLKNAMDKSPTKRLAAKVHATELIAAGVRDDSESDDDRQRAIAWSRRAKNLSRKLEMPVPGVRGALANRKSVRMQLAQLQDDMAEHLDSK